MAYRSPTHDEYVLLCDWHEDEIEVFASADATLTKFEAEFLPDHTDWIESCSVDTVEGTIQLVVNFYKSTWNSDTEEFNDVLSSEGMVLSSE
jgi:hypothetical protein